MNPPSLDLAKFLAGKSGLGSLHGSDSWSVHVASEPDKPYSVVTIYDTIGTEPDTDELDVFRPSFQVRVRSRDYTQAFNIQEAVRDLLIMGPVETETSLFSLIVLSSDILHIGTDDNDLHLLTANYRSRRTEKET